MNSPRNHHHEHHDVHQQRLLWFFSFCNQRSSSNSSSSGGSGSTRRSSTKVKSASSRNKFALQYQKQLQQQQRQRQYSNVFGRELTEHTQTFKEDDYIPNIVKSCTTFIEKHGIIFGIYRLSGTRGNITKLRQDFDKNPKISMIDIGSISNDAHAVACVLKQYFRELPTPLLTFHMYEKFIDLFKNGNIIHQDSETNDSYIDKTNKLQEQKDKRNYGIDIDKRKYAKPIERINTKPNSAIKSTVSKPVSMKMSPSTTITAQPQSNTEPIVTNKYKQSQFITSVSDSQLISLSSVVATTVSDVKYIVRLDELRRLLLKLPRAHYQTLKYLMRHLAFMASQGHKTGMDSKNVAIVWAPNLLKPPEVSAELETLQVIGLQAVITEQLIKNHKFLFDDPDDPIESIDVGSELDSQPINVEPDKSKSELAHSHTPESETGPEKIAEKRPYAQRDTQTELSECPGNQGVESKMESIDADE